jgi:hypothetical protein
MSRTAWVVIAFLAAHAVELIQSIETELRGCSQISATKALVDKIASRRYTMWVLDADRECPDSFEELGVRPFGPDRQRLLMVCGDIAPPEATGFGVIAAGPDHWLGTCDDINSWEPIGDQLRRCSLRQCH